MAFASHGLAVRGWIRRLTATRSPAGLAGLPSTVTARLCLTPRTETEWFRICWDKATAVLFMAKRITFVTPDGSECTTRSGEKANSGAPPVLVAFGDYDAMRLRQFAAQRGGALVDGWKLFGAASLFSEAAE
jgi:hypothetical protein